jgi:Superinfection immunity protein
MGTIILIVTTIGLYFMPAYIAVMGGHKQRMAIFVVNLFLGWTLLGWVGALVWAFTKT